jgi:hypothetical protein
MATIIQADMAELDQIIADCEGVITELTEVEKGVTELLYLLDDSYQGKATVLIDDMQTPVKGHVTLLRELYSSLVSYVGFAKETLTAQDAAVAAALSAGVSGGAV